MSKQAKHTPEPWQVAHGGSARAAGELGTDLMVVSDDPAPGIGVKWTVCHLYGDGTKTRGLTNANARLIAAASALLRALEDLTSEIKLGKLNIRKDFSLINAHAAGIKAIHQATGE